MRVQYGDAITESEIDLKRLEKSHRGKKVLPRIQMLRLLKIGKAKTQPECARMVGFSLAQIERWWACYREQGLSGLLNLKRGHEKPSRLTPEAWAGLEEEMTQGKIPHLKDAQIYLEKSFHIHYSLSAIQDIFHKRRVKWKTGRPRHRKADPQAQSDFKKKFPA
jgi:transposase